jgi:putative membrane protein insertion efficiency factor
VPRRLLLGLIDFYRKGISPLTPPSCRFTPTCSAYAREAIERFGAIRGGWLFLKRFARCHPFGGYGFDPVPSSLPSTPVGDAAKGEHGVRPHAGTEELHRS